MPPRDEHDYEARRQQIIEGALQVFSRDGYEKATNIDIARAAKIKSPGLIYHYFKDKADLFRQVVEERANVLQFLLRSDDMMDREPREVLTEFARNLVTTLDNRTSVPMFKMMLGESIRRPAVAAMFNQIGPWRAFRFLSRYLEHQMDLGKLRRMDPGAAVRCLVGPLLAFVLTREVFVQADSATLSPETMVETAVSVFLEGMEIKSDSAPD
ncbi:MAG TPA: TetR/AcrR family transcriptional regulator [Chloroflexia bacterium]|nr:TetR/AcrR family transcriptional regulator [Chloroflexia bacterium]